MTRGPEPTAETASSAARSSAARSSAARSSAARSSAAQSPTGQSTAGAPTHERQRNLPFAWFGYAYATVVGFVWGSIWSTGAVERIDGLWVFRGMPKWTFGRGGSCVGSCYLTDQNVSPAVLRHEHVHRRQWRRYGLAMPFLYFLAGRNPLRNRFEIEAGLKDGGYIR